VAVASVKPEGKYLHLAPDR